MEHKDFVLRLRELKACPEAIDFVAQHRYSFKEAGETCERADWMLWYIFRAGMGTKRDRIHLVCDCASTALKYVPKGEDRPRKAIEATRKYADNPTEENRVAAHAAAYVAHVAYAAANAAAAAAAAAATAVYAAKKQAHIKMCNMIRKKVGKLRWKLR